MKQVRYETSVANKVGVQATVTLDAFLQTTYPVAEAELQISFDITQISAYDFYTVHWVEPDRDITVGWHQDETHVVLGECHSQIDYRGKSGQ